VQCNAAGYALSPRAVQKSRVWSIAEAMVNREYARFDLFDGGFLRLLFDVRFGDPRLRIPSWKGPGADSEEKHEPVSDIDICTGG
jgi:hypothetical protein